MFRSHCPHNIFLHRSTWYSQDAVFCFPPVNLFFNTSQAGFEVNLSSQNESFNSQGHFPISYPLDNITGPWNSALTIFAVDSNIGSAPKRNSLNQRQMRKTSQKEDRIPFELMVFKCVLYLSLASDTVSDIMPLCAMPTWLPMIALILHNPFFLYVYNFTMIYFSTIFPFEIISMSPYRWLPKHNRPSIFKL